MNIQKGGYANAETRDCCVAGRCAALAYFVRVLAGQMDDYKRNYEDGFYAGVDAANKADAACLLDGPGSGIGVNAEILDSYLAGEGVYTYDDAKDAIESLYRCYDELLELYGEIEDGRVDVYRPD